MNEYGSINRCQRSDKRNIKYVARIDEEENGKRFQEHLTKSDLIFNYKLLSKSREVARMKSFLRPANILSSLNIPPSCRLQLVYFILKDNGEDGISGSSKL